MTQSRKERIYWTAAICALVVTLVVLAALQYRWSRELDEAAGTRMRSNLQASMVGFRMDLARELGGITQALQVESDSPLNVQAADYVRQLQEWQRSAAHPELVANIYLLRISGSERKLHRLNYRTSTFVETNWPKAFSRLKDSLSQDEPAGMLIAPLLGRGPQPHRGQHGPGFPVVWQIELQIPALIRANDRGPFPPEGRRADGPRESVIVELNEAVFRNQVLPELAERYFGDAGGLAYDVAVVERGASERLVFSTGSQLGSNTNVASDARLNLFGPPFGPNSSPSHIEGRVMPPPEDRLFQRQRAFAMRFEALGDKQRGTWELLAKHRKGSLEAALASIRHQHLFISFGVLLLLTATVAMVIVATRRAQILAKQQMEFVAGVSHELRTPLAVITSAAENIADGIVTNPSKVVQYGDVIRKHSRQLTQLVEQVLQFAAARNNSSHYTLSPTQPAEIIVTALYRSAELLSNGGFTVEREIAPNLPQVMVDSEAVCQCLQNLITNAIKYSGDNKSIRVIASETNERPHEVRITVQDKGIGITRSELRRIFDPFYRSPEVVNAQIRGTGLGLALSRSIADSMGGRLTVTSEIGKGSAFTLHLPVANESATKPSIKAVSATVSGVEKDEPKNTDR